MKRHAPATERNRAPILAALRSILPAQGLVLEIASGTGEHAAYFAAHLPVSWQPSDVAADALASIAAYRTEARLPNLRPPVEIDVRAPSWPLASADAIVCINMIHIAPWECCEALLAGGARLLAPGAPLVLYGPFCFDGMFTAPSNASFDASLRAQNPAWGVRDLSDVTRAAALAGFSREEVVALPANNHVVVFRRHEARA